MPFIMSSTNIAKMVLSAERKSPELKLDIPIGYKPNFILMLRWLKQIYISINHKLLFIRGNFHAFVFVCLLFFK